MGHGVLCAAKKKKVVPQQFFEAWHIYAWL